MSELGDWFGFTRIFTEPFTRIFTRIFVRGTGDGGGGISQPNIIVDHQGNFIRDHQGNFIEY